MEPGLPSGSVHVPDLTAFPFIRARCSEKFGSEGRNVKGGIENGVWVTVGSWAERRIGRDVFCTRFKPRLEEENHSDGSGLGWLAPASCESPRLPQAFSRKW